MEARNPPTSSFSKKNLKEEELMHWVLIEFIKKI
jgi:hypothetical protein